MLCITWVDNLMSNKKKKKELTFKQRKAIIIMIKQNIKTYDEIARILGVSPRTLFNWRKQEEFSQAFIEAFEDLKRRMESSVELPIQLEALGDLKNYKATAINNVEIANAINELIERKHNLIEKQEIYESKLETLYKTAEQLKKNLIQIKKDIEKIKTQIAKD